MKTVECGKGCEECDGKDKCTKCEVGYQLDRGICKGNFIEKISSLFMLIYNGYIKHNFKLSKSWSNMCSWIEPVKHMDTLETRI